MKTWSTFWKVIEEVRNGVAVRSEWQLRLGADWDLAVLPLRPTDRIANCVSRSADPFEPPWDVIEYGPDDFVLVPERRDQRAIPAKRSELLLYRLDRVSLHKKICAALGLCLVHDGRTEVPLAKLVGAHRPFAGSAIPMFLVTDLDDNEFARTLDALLARHQSFILAAPTDRLVKPIHRSLLQSASSVFLPLCDCITTDARGEWIGTDFAKKQLESLSQTAVAETVTTDGVVFFRTPANAAWSNLRLTFRDRETLTAKIGSVSQVLTYTEMGMANQKNKKPTKQWELLYAFGECSGQLTWASPAASRKNQKRREHLANNLREFFRIEGEPILYDPDTKGWRTTFEIVA